MIGEKFVRNTEQKSNSEVLKVKKNMNTRIFVGMIALLFMVAFLMTRKVDEEPKFELISSIDYVQKIASYIELDDIEVKYIERNQDMPGRYLILGNGLRYFTVEFYDTYKMALNRADQLKEINTIIQKIDSSKDFSTILESIGARYFMADSIVFDNMVIYYSQQENNKIKEQVKSVINEINSQYGCKRSSEWDSTLRKINKDIFGKNFNDCLNGLDQQINIALSQKVDLSKEDINDFKESIAPFATVKSVEPIYKKWKRYCDLIVEGKLKGSQEFNDILEYVSKIVYKKGEYTVGIDIPEGYYIYLSNKKTEEAYFHRKYWTQDVIVYLKKEEKIELGYSQELYTLENSPQLEVNGQTSGVFKVGQHIKAGTYTLTAASNQPACYWIIEGDNPDKLLSLNTNRIFEAINGCKKIPAYEKEKITLKEGQILYLLDGTLE